jgi:hypothetical protein
VLQFERKEKKNSVLQFERKKIEKKNNVLCVLPEAL